MRTPFVLIPQYFGGIVFRRSDARYLPFDGETTDLLRKLVGFRIDQVLADLAPNDPKREELCRFFEVFEKQGWFTPAGRFAAEILDLDPPPDHLAGPLAVHLEVTADCNLRCSHCFTGDLSARTLDGAPLTLPELQRLFAELASCGSFRLGLTGGEPLLRKDLLEIIDSAIDAGLHPCLTTKRPSAHRRTCTATGAAKTPVVERQPGRGHGRDERRRARAGDVSASSGGNGTLAASPRSLWAILHPEPFQCG